MIVYFIQKKNYLSDFFLENFIRETRTNHRCSIYSGLEITFRVIQRKREVSNYSCSIVALSLTIFESSILEPDFDLLKKSIES